MFHYNEEMLAGDLHPLTANALPKMILHPLDLKGGAFVIELGFVSDL